MLSLGYGGPITYFEYDYEKQDNNIFDNGLF
jgi:hypothetical protein